MCLSFGSLQPGLSKSLFIYISLQLSTFACLFALLPVAALAGAGHTGHVAGVPHEIVEAYGSAYPAYHNVSQADFAKYVKTEKLEPAVVGLKDEHAGHDHSHGDHGESDEIAADIFKVWDNNTKDGFLSETELDLLVDSLAPKNTMAILMPVTTAANAAADALAEKFIKEFDTNSTNSGSLTEHEFAAGCRKYKLSYLLVMGVVDPHDHSGHDHGSTDEYDEVAEAAMVKYDLDKNGLLSEAELISMIKARGFTEASMMPQPKAKGLNGAGVAAPTVAAALAAALAAVVAQRYARWH